MNTVRLKHVCLFTLLLPLLLILGIGNARAQFSRGPAQNFPHGKPFVDIHAPMPREVTRKPVQGITRANTAPAQTVDITPNTAAVQDLNPSWPKFQSAANESPIAFQSNRSDLRGAQAPGSLFHVYRMDTDGSNITALTGPLVASGLGALTNQTEPSFNATATTAVYVESDAAGNALDILELTLTTGQARSLVKNNPDFQFVGLSHPEYGVVPGGNIGVIFAGQVTGQANFHIYAVDTQSGRVRQLTAGNCDDRNPTLSPDPAKPVIAFDSNRASPNGSSTKANRDIWAIDANHPLTPAVRVTNFQTSDNIQPTFSTNKIDQPGSNQHPVNGQQLIAFSTTRINTQPQNGSTATGVNPNGTHDIYWLKITIDVDPNNPSNFTILNPINPANPPENNANRANELTTSDRNHIYDDLHPAWPQFITTYRVAYHSDRSFYNPANGDSGPPKQPYDIFASNLIDLNSPTLVRFDEITGEVCKIEPRIAAPGSQVKISVKVTDLETGVRDVYVQLKNPNSKYQSVDGLEHKVFAFSFLSPDGSNCSTIPLNTAVPVEYESEPIFIGPVNGSGVGTDPRFNSYPRTGANAQPPTYLAGLDDFFAFSGQAHPAAPNWLKLNLESIDPSTGIATYSSLYQTANTPSDFYMDVIVYDNALNAFARGGNNTGSNWKIYDNVYGFTTQTFNANHGILFVSDYAPGQKFFLSRFGSAQLTNVFNSFWGTESWMTDIDVSLLPTTVVSCITPGQATTLLNVANTLGVGSYGAAGVYRDSLQDDGTRIDGRPVPPTQTYDMWRILCRGPVPDSVLAQFGSFTEQQPPDTIAGEKNPRTVRVIPRCVIWHAPFTGNVFAGPGTLTDLAVQAQLHNYLQAGNRLIVNGQDIGWALTLDGAAPNSFFSNDLRAQYVADRPGGGFERVTTFGAFPVFIRFSGEYVLTAAGVGNAITHDPWDDPTFTTPLRTNHCYPGPPIPPDCIDFIHNEPLFQIPGNDPMSPKTWASPSNFWPDSVRPINGAVSDITYGGGTTAVLHYDDPATGARLLYAPMGLEGLAPDAFGVNSILFLKNRRAELIHNTVCWFRTGSIVGTVLDVDGGAPLTNVLVRLSHHVDASGNPIIDYTGLTRSDGTFSINGVVPGRYEITAVKPGFTIQRRTFATTHGGYRDTISFRMTKAEPSNITGKVTKTDGTTAIAGATVTATDAISGAVFTAVTAIDGTYTVQRVPSQTKYILTVVGPNDQNGVPLYGASVPVSYQVPNPNDPDPTQRDGIVAPAKTYKGFDFQLKPVPGNISGRVIESGTNNPIAGAVVTATASVGNATTTAVSQADGRFTFTGLDPGIYGFVATAPGYAPNASVTGTVTAGGNTTVSQDLVLSRVPPGSISGLVTRTSDNSPLAGVAITVKDGAGTTIASGQTGAVQTNGSYRFNYKLDVPAGVTYTVTASMSGFTPSPASQQAKVDSGVETQNINFAMDPLHTFAGSLSLVSAPFDYPASDVGDLLAIPQGDRINQTFLFATWDLGGYIFYPNPPANTFRLGRGYFMRYKTNMPLSTLGVAADPSGFEIPLNPGWNLIGDPYNFEIDWTRIAVVYNGITYAHDDATQATSQHPLLIGNSLYTFVSGSYVSAFSLQPWKGYWVRAFAACTLHINPVTDKTGRATAIPGGTGRAALGGGQGWSLNLQLSAGGMRDTDNFVGVTTRAVDGYDRYKAMKPPAFGDQYTYLSIDHNDWGAQSGSFGIDMRSATPGAKVWNITAQTTVLRSTATLYWPNAATLGRGVSLYLTDLATGATRNMRSGGSYTWQTGDKPENRQFKIEAVSATRNGALVISGVAGRQAPGRSAGLSISYTLSGPANVEVRILGASGSVVRSLNGRASRAAGVNETVWDLKSNAGVAMPAGAYIVEIRAQDGKDTVRTATPIVITR